MTVKGIKTVMAVASSPGRTWGVHCTLYKSGCSDPGGVDSWIRIRSKKIYPDPIMMKNRILNPPIK